MTIQRGKQVKIISGISAEDFESKLNKELSELNASGTKYDMQLSPQTGFVAYIVYEQETKVAESIKDEFELAGEKHICLECPHYILPTDGRVKYTRCMKVGGITHKDRDCCENFYEWLFNGEIELREVMKIGKKSA